MEDRRGQAIRNVLADRHLQRSASAPRHKPRFRRCATAGCNAPDPFITCEASGKAANRMALPGQGWRASVPTGSTEKVTQDLRLQGEEAWTHSHRQTVRFYKGEGKTVYERVSSWWRRNRSLWRCREGAAVPAIDPAIVAQQAVDQTKLQVLARRETRAQVRKCAVGVPMWLWVTPSATTFDRTRVGVGGRGDRSPRRRRSRKIVWNMGDGEKVVCNGPALRSTSTRSGVESPDCAATLPGALHSGAGREAIGCRRPRTGT